MTKLKNLSSAFVVLFLFTACTTLGVPEADTFNKRVVVAYNLVGVLATSTSNLLVAKKITVSEAKSARQTLNAAGEGIVAAESLVTTDLKSADSRLTAIRAVLTTLQSYLLSKESK